MQSLNNNQNYDIKFKDLTKRQKVALVTAVIFTIAFIALLCYSADKVELKIKKLAGLLFFLGLFLFLIIDIYYLVMPDKELRISGIIKANSYLFDYDFHTLPPVYTKKYYEVIFTDDSEINISFTYLKNKYWDAWLIYKDCYFSIYKLYRLFVIEEVSEIEKIEYPDFPDLLKELLNYRKKESKSFFGILDLIISENYIF